MGIILLDFRLGGCFKILFNVNSNLKNITGVGTLIAKLSVE